MTDMTKAEGEREILRIDSRGRVRTSSERREALLDEFEKSGVSAVKFAALIGVNYQTFIGWVRNRRRRSGDCDGTTKTAAEVAPQINWLEAVVEGAHPPVAASTMSSALWVHLPGGARLEITGAGQVALAAELLRILEKPASRLPSC